MTVLSTIILLILLIAAPDVSAEIPNELKTIQKEGHNYYRINRKAQSAVYRGVNVSVEKQFHVLPKNAPGSCSHDVAIKIKLIRERMPHLIPMVAVYDMNVGSRTYSHAVVVITNPNGGYFVLNNRNMWVYEFDNLKGFRNIKLMTYETALSTYNK